MTFKKYSPFEIKLLEAIPEDGSRVATTDLVSIVYENEAPLSARQSVLDCVKKLIRKVDHNEEQFEIFRTSAHGSTPVCFWREIRRNKQFEEDFFKEKEKCSAL